MQSLNSGYVVASADSKIKSGKCGGAKAKSMEGKCGGSK